MPYGITHCYLPPASGENPLLPPAEAGTRRKLVFHCHCVRIVECVIVVICAASFVMLLLTDIVANSDFSHSLVDFLTS